MLYNWVYQTDEQVNNNSKIRTKKHFPRINAKEKFQGMDSPSHTSLKRTRRSSSDSDNSGDQAYKNLKLFRILNKRPRIEDDSQWEENRIKALDKDLKNGADINFKHHGKTILHIAVSKKYKEIVTFLLKNRAKIIADKRGLTPLDLAKKLGLTDIITIIEKHMQSHSDNTGTVIDFLRTKLQQLELSDEKITLSDNELKKLNQPDKDGNTPLLWEVVTKSKENINLLIRCGADVNYQNQKTQQRAIDIAWNNLYYDGMLILLKADSHFPKDFTLDSLHGDSGIPNELKEFVRKREELHTWIKSDNLIEVRGFVKNRVSKFFNSENKSAQEIAAAHASVEILEATLGIMLSISDDKSTLSKARQKLLSNINSEGNSLLLIATKNRKKENIDFLIRCGVDVNYQNPETNKKAADLAWQDKNYDIVLALLKADSYFPQEFNLESLNEDDNSQKQLKDFVQARNDFHELIKEEKLKEVKDFILKDKSRFYLSSEGQSAVLAAIKNKKYEIYAFLKSTNVHCLDKEIEEIKKVRSILSYQEKETLRNAMIPYFPSIQDAHILHLISRSRAQKPINNFQEKIEKFYRALDAIPEISCILKVLQFVNLDVVFDFDNTNIQEVCPHAEQISRGITMRLEERIYIAAGMEESMVLGTLAHELTHLAMIILYDNNFNPYNKHEAENKEKFAKIVTDIQKRKDVTGTKYINTGNPLVVILQIFIHYEKEQYDQELIVRIPHILAQYGDRVGRDFLADYNEITSYYKDHVEKDCTSYINDNFFIKPRNTIKLLNQIIGEVRNIQEFRIKLQNPINIDSIFGSNQGKLILLLNSKSTLLSSLSIYQALEDRQGIVKDDYLLLKFEHCVKHIVEVFQAFCQVVSKTLIIEYSKNSDDAQLLIISYQLSIFFKNNPQKKRVIFIVDESKIDVFKAALSADLSNKCLEVQDKYQFSDLTSASQEHILEKRVIFQGKKIKLNNIDEDIKEIIDTQTLVDLIEGKEIKIGTKPLEVNNLGGSYTKVYQQIPNEALLRIRDDASALYVINVIGQSNIKTAIDRLIQKCGIFPKDIGEFSLDATVNHNKMILTKLGTIEEEEFKQLCSNVGNNKIVIYLIDWEGDKFVLRQFHNTQLYINRVLYERVIIKDEIKELLSSNNLQEKFIFSNVDDKERFVRLFSFDEGQEGKQENFQRNCANSNLIQILTPIEHPQDIFLNSIQQDPMKLIHLFKVRRIKDSMKIIWIDSHGSTTNIMKYRDTSINNFIDEEEFFDRVNNYEMLVLVDDAGMGKSTILTKLAADKTDSDLIIRINFNECTNAVASLPFETSDFEQVANFLLNIKGADFDHPLAKNLLKKKLEHITEKKPLLLLFDGFNEIRDNSNKLHKRKVINLLKFLQGKATIVITTRYSEKLFLLKSLKEFTIYRLKDIAVPAQHLYLEKLWKTPLKLTLSGEQLKKIDNRFRIYSELLFNKIHEILQGNSHFLGIPLLLRLSGEGLLNRFIEFIAKNDDSLAHLNIGMLDLYKFYVDGKYDIFTCDTKNADRKNILYTVYNENHWRLAIKEIFPSYVQSFGDLLKVEDTVLSELSHIGIVDAGSHNYEFFHHTFAEYFFAAQLIPHLDSSDTVKLLIIEALYNKDGNVIRSFFNEYLEGNFLSDTILKKFGQYISDLQGRYNRGPLCNNCETMLHIAIKEGNDNIVNFLLESMKYNQRILNIFLKGRTKHNLSSLDYAILYSDDVVTFNKIFDKVTDRRVLQALIHNNLYGNILNIALSRVNDKHLKNILSKLAGDTRVIKELLLNQKEEKGNALYWACYGQGDDLYNMLYNSNDYHQPNVFPIEDNTLYQRINDLAGTLLDYVNMIDNNKAILKELLISNNKNFLPLHIAVTNRNHDMVIKLLETARSIDNDVLEDILLATNKDQNTVLHIASLISGNYGMIEALLYYAKSINNDVLEDILLTANKDQNTVLHIAVKNGNYGIVVKLLDDAKGINNDVLKNLLLIPNKDQCNVLHIAVISGNYGIVVKLLDDAKGINNDVLEGLLTAFDNNDRNALHLAAVNSKYVIIEELLDIDNNILKNLLLIPNKDQCNVLHIAVTSGNYEIVCKLLKATRKINNDVLEDLLLSLDKDQNTALHIAVTNGNYGIVEELLEVPKLVNQYSILEELLTTPDRNSRNALHLAAISGNCDMVITLLETAKYINNDVLEELLTTSDNRGRNALNIAVTKRNYDIVIKLLEAPNDNKEIFIKLRQSIDNLTGAYINQIKQIMGDFIIGSRNKEQILNSVQDLNKEFFQQELTVSSNIDPTNPSYSIALTCLTSISRRKRSTTECKIGWEDVDKISKSKTRNHQEIIIDAEKFLNHVQHVTDEQESQQLVRLVEEIKNKDSKKIVGEHQKLLNEVIKARSYNKYIQEERMKYVGYNIINDQSMSPKFKLLAMHAMGWVQLMRGIHSAIAACYHGTIGDCSLSTAGLGFAFLSNLIEKGMSHITPIMMIEYSNMINKAMPKIFSQETKYVVQITGVKYGTKIGAGLGAAIGGTFDIIDIARSSIALIECYKRTGSDNPCSDKEIRDNIVSIGFGGVGFVSGIVFVVTGATGIGIVVGFALMVGQSIYFGVSNVIEYHDKYHTTLSEEWSIFWRTVLFQDMAPDVQHLVASTDAINKIADYGRKILESSPQVMAFATGLGAVNYEEKCAYVSKRHMCTSPIFCNVPEIHDGKISQYYVIKECSQELNITPDYIKINMQNYSKSNTQNISRVIPSHIDNIQMICLPKITNADYEKSSSSSLPIDYAKATAAIYYCENAMVLLDTKKINSSSGDKWIVYDLRYANKGEIIGSNTLNNEFLIFAGEINILGGANTNNRFNLYSDQYQGRIDLVGNSTNTISVHELQCSNITVKYTNDGSIVQQLPNILIHRQYKMYISMCGNIVSVYGNEESLITYVGRENETDYIDCLVQNTSNIDYINNVVIDSLGGKSFDKQDIINNCNKVVVSPNTKVIGNRIISNNNGTFWIKSGDYAGIFAISTIEFYGNATVIFSRSLLKSQLSYFAHTNTLSIYILSGFTRTWQLNLMPYIDHDSGLHNFQLVSFGNTTVTPIFNSTQNVTDIDQFQLFGEYGGDLLSEAVDYYEKNFSSNRNQRILGTIKFKNKLLIFGSSESNSIGINEDTVCYVKGGGGGDVYVMSNISYSNYKDQIFISNKASDRNLDILVLNSSINSIERYNDSLLINNYIVIQNYMLGAEYQHIALTDDGNNFFIPWHIDKKEWKLLPFYRASFSKNVFILSADDLKPAVIDVDLNNVIFYREDDNLLLSAESTQDSHPLIIIFKDYYTQQQKWQYVKIYSYNRDSHVYNENSHINLATVKLSDNTLYEYDNLMPEYTVDFNDPVKLIQPNNTLLQSGSKIPVIIFKDVNPDYLQVKSTQEDIILLDVQSNHELRIKNWHNNQYPVILEFNFNNELRPIRLYFSDEDMSYLQYKISKASRLQLNMYYYINYRLENILKCLISPRITNINEGYAILGFHSPEHQQIFVTECNSTTFRMDDLNQYQFVAKPYVEMLSDYAVLKSNNDTIVQQYTNIIEQDITPVVTRIDRMILFNYYLHGKLGQIPLGTVHAVECLLKVYCDQSYDYDIKGSILDKLIYNLLVDYIEIIEKSNKDLTSDGGEQYLTSDDSSKALILLAFKIYNELILKYPDVEEDLLYNNCFNTILSDSHISGMLKYLNVNSTYPNMSYVDNFVDSNYKDIQLMGSNSNRLINITGLSDVIDTSHDSNHKHRHHHGENHYRERRDIGDHSTIRKRELNKELKKEEGNIVDQDNYSDQASTEHKNTNVKSNDWVSWMKWPKFNIFLGAEAAGTENIVINQQEYKPVDNTVYNTDVVIGEDYHSIDRSEIHKDIAEDLLVEDNKATEAESSSNMLVDNVTTVFTNGMNLFKGTISKISKLISDITNSNSSNYPSDELSVNDNTDYIVRNKATNAASSLAIDDGSNNNNIQEVTTGFDLHGTLMLGQYIISKKLGRNNSLSSNYITPKQKHTMEVNKLAATILPFLQNDDFSNDTRDYRANQKDIYENNSSEEILADSISIFGKTTVYENNDMN